MFETRADSKTSSKTCPLIGRPRWNAPPMLVVSGTSLAPAVVEVFVTSQLSWQQLRSSNPGSAIVALMTVTPGCGLAPRRGFVRLSAQSHTEQFGDRAASMRWASVAAIMDCSPVSDMIALFCSEIMFTGRGTGVVDRADSSTTACTPATASGAGM